MSLTFDDGPWNTYTDEILAILKQYNVKAVFCMVGNQAARPAVRGAEGGGRRAHPVQPSMSH
ncbi:polysaccharide deacetylase family protein [Yinghuangia aomiensis]